LTKAQPQFQIDFASTHETEIGVAFDQKEPMMLATSESLISACSFHAFLEKCVAG